MIITQLSGGLGNQMFQYAAGRALSERHGVPLRLDVRLLSNPASDNTPRRYALDAFAVSGSIATPAELYSHAVYRRLWLAGRLREQSHAFNGAFELAGPRTYLEGYWQTERYFQVIASIIRQEFTVRLPLDFRASALLNEVQLIPSVSVHIRRGDYVTDPVTGAFHGTLSLDYYARATNWLAERFAKLRFYVFSDDPEWTRVHVQLPGPTTIVDFHDSENAHHDLSLMRACQHHVVANSSFSWWGAWLSDRPGKMVVAPRHWFRAQEVDTSDVCPPDWLRL